MKKVFLGLAVLALFALLGSQAMAGNTATQTLSFQVSAINEISVSADPAAFNIHTATAGSQPDDVVDATTTYNLTTNGTGKKLTAQITTGGSMPSDTKLFITMDNTGVGQGGLEKEITNAASAQDTVTAITKKVADAKTISYRFNATVDAGVLVGQDAFQKTVTLSLVDG